MKQGITSNKIQLQSIRNYFVSAARKQRTSHVLQKNYSQVNWKFEWALPCDDQVQKTLATSFPLWINYFYTFAFSTSTMPKFSHTIHIKKHINQSFYLGMGRMLII